MAAKPAVTSAERIRSYRGPAILSFGFRPFFLGAALWAAFSMVAWMFMLAGWLSLPIELPPLQWHVHELLYGFLPAVAAGFLLTAVPNWTGRLPVTGPPLLALVLAWVAGRAATLSSAAIGEVAAAAVDVMFLVVLLVILAREILAGKNYRNLSVLAIIGILLLGNIMFHWEALRGGGNAYGTRLGIAAAVALITQIGGRIIPSFTRNWLAKQGSARLPAPFGTFDRIAMATGLAALALWVAAPEGQLTALACLAAGVLHAARLARWQGWQTWGERLVLVLHVAYAFIPLGFVLVALCAITPAYLLPTAAVHAWTAGAIGLMTLAVMTRASLGHTGQALAATRSIEAIYALALIAAVTRVLAGTSLAPVTIMLDIAATAWVGAFGGFAIVYWPLLTKPRPGGG